MANKKVDKNDVVIGRIEDTIKNLEKKEFTMYFFVVDSKNIPNGSMRYVYQLAKGFEDEGYNVCMLYQLDNEYKEEDVAALKEKKENFDDSRVFTGVRKWMGDAFADMKHLNIQNGTWTVGPADFLFIPEAFSSLMYEVYKNKIPCKRYVILQNFDYLTENITVGYQLANYGINSVVATNPNVLNTATRYFPYIKDNSTVISPYIPSYFCKPSMAKNLIVNIVASEKTDVHRIYKSFYWAYPEYRFVTFRDLRGLPMGEFAKELQEGCITIWVDERTPFGYSALEAIRCGNVLIGKIPNDVPEWMTEDNGIWFNNINDVPDILARVIKAWVNDAVPEEITEAMEKTNERYTYTEFQKSVIGFGEKMIADRIKDLEALKKGLEKQE